MLHAAKYLGAIGIGATSPQLFLDSNNEVYVVKLQANRLGPKVLVNELLAARLGERLGLPFPAGDVMTVGANVIKASRRLQMARIKPGLHFACKYIGGSEYVGRRNLAKAVNKPEMAGIILFDHMFHNIDRTLNRKNLLVRKEEGGYRLYAIDHSHLFHRGRWTVETLAKLGEEVRLNRMRSFGLLLKYFLSEQDFAVYIARFKAISDGELRDIIDSIPAEWLPDAKEREALLAFLIRRRDMTEIIAGRICSLLPDKNRSADIHKDE